MFAALVDADDLLVWLPPEGMTGSFDRFDCRPGGSYRLELTYLDQSASPGKTTEGSDIVEARFLAIVVNEEVVQAIDFVSDDPAFAGTMTMTWSVTATSPGTRVEITAEGVPDGISEEDHAAGMASSLLNLARHLEGTGDTPSVLDYVLHLQGCRTHARTRSWCHRPPGPRRSPGGREAGRTRGDPATRAGSSGPPWPVPSYSEMPKYSPSL